MENRRGANRNKPNSKNKNVKEDRSKKTGFKTSGSYKKDPTKKPTSRTGGASNNKGVAKRSLDGKIRLNRFLAQAGICSRREADELISTGAVEINGKVVMELGTKVDPQTDNVNYGGQKISVQKSRYVLINKPKDFTTISKSGMNRKTVMELVSNACIEPIIPIDKLDKSYLGLILLTNDNQLLDKLTNTKIGANKIYHVEVNRTFQKSHIQALLDGVELEDGMVKADFAEYANNGTDKTAVLVTLKSGKPKVASRLFEHLGYKVFKVDRVGFAGLDKKGLPRGKWRHLSDEEIGFLKMS
jgi:23S rRNA pseudouridine2605 synthase